MAEEAPHNSPGSGDPTAQFLQILQSTLAQNMINVENLIKRSLDARLGDGGHDNTGKGRGGGGGGDNGGDKHEHEARVNPKASPVSYKAFKSCGANNFHGTTDPVEAYDWISHTEKIFEISKSDKADRVMYASALLKGPANDWWENEQQALSEERKKNLDWEGFKELYLTEYCPSDVRRSYPREFLDIKQGDRTVSEYRTEFWRKSKFASQYVASEEDQVHRFIEGLRLDIREDVIGKDVPTFEKAAELARLREQFLVLKYADSPPPAKKAHTQSFSSPSGN